MLTRCVYFKLVPYSHIACMCVSMKLAYLKLQLHRCVTFVFHMACVFQKLLHYGCMCMCLMSNGISHSAIIATVLPSPDAVMSYVQQPKGLQSQASRTVHRAENLLNFRISRQCPYHPPQQFVLFRSDTNAQISTLCMRH